MHFALIFWQCVWSVDSQGDLFFDSLVNQDTGESEKVSFLERNLRSPTIFSRQMNGTVSEQVSNLLPPRALDED